MSLVKQTAQLVEAYVSRNEVSPEELTELIREVYQSLSGLSSLGGAGADVISQSAAMAPVKASYDPGAIAAMNSTLAPSQAQAPTRTATKEPAAPAAPRRITSAVPLDKAVTQDAVYCLICGKACKTLRGHLSKTHGIDVIQYRNSYNLDKNFPLVAPSYSEKRRNLAIANGLGERLQESRRAAANTSK